MALIADDYVWVVKWNKQYQPDPRPKVGDIYGGLRAAVGSRAKDVTSPCQFWIKGMPGICVNFTGTNCSLGGGGGSPSGYNNGYCDQLGRRSWCDRYESSGDKLDEYICIAPDMFRTGLGKRDTAFTEFLVKVPYTKEEILGYNEADGVGRCDGIGMGRGEAGFGTKDPEEMYKLPVVCRHYKPYIMGFGAIKPRPMGESVLQGRNIYDGTSADPLSDLTRYLPFSFNMYNARAQAQKCIHWNQDYGANFEMDYSGGYASIVLSEDPLTECVCESDECTPYKTITGEWLPNTSDTLMDVLTEENGIICNGAKPECPCYSGKWTYCVDDNMRDGMRITAEQIFELRFYMGSFQTKDMYDAIFAEKTGASDLTTSDIFAFSNWEVLGAKPEDSIMEGKRIYQCFPIPLNNMEFDAEEQLTKESITYPKAQCNKGTLGGNESTFPTLVRDTTNIYSTIPLDVVYPYTSDDPWSETACNETDSYKNMEMASCKLENPKTVVLGYTVRNKTVYALNITKIKNVADIFLKFKNTRLSLLSTEQRDNTNREIKKAIETVSKDVTLTNYITNCTSNDYGYFGTGPVQLEYNKINSIAVICMWHDGCYEVVVRDVFPKFYGACIVQDKFKFEYETTDESTGYIVGLPTYFNTGAEIYGHVESFGGITSSVFPVYNKYIYGIEKDTVQYSYCINEYTFSSLVKKWCRIGPTGYILAEIDNVDISYLLDFEVIEATIDGNSDKCGSGNVELEVIFPKEDDVGATRRAYLLPNSVILKSNVPQVFFNSDWGITIKYKYRILEISKPGDDNAVTVWPPDLDGEHSCNEFVNTPFTLEYASGNAFKVNNIKFSTVEVMAYIVDDKGRLQSAVAAKMLCDVVTTRCRPVEISYSYRADAVAYDLIPNDGFFTWVGGDKVLPGTYSHYMKALCGDHDCDPANCKGPMWFPFDNCTTMDFYSWYSGAATCTMPVEGQPRSDWRYRMADEFKAWVREGSNWAAACGNGWYYSYSKAGKSEFDGYGKIRTSVPIKEYGEIGWSLPPFGNDGREITERWLSQEHYSFWDLSGVEPTPRSEYMPLVFDDEMLFMSFNAFSEEGRIGPINNCFHSTCLLNCMTSSLINETMGADRFRFSDIFNVIKNGVCMYPPPAYEYASGITFTRRYGFKDNTVAWAWREHWKEIERGCNNNKVLDFVDFVRPNNYFDAEKVEHRLITDEGHKKITYVAPVVGGSIENYELPYIYIGEGGAPRQFEIIYDDYNSEQVDWVDESAPTPPNFEGGGGGGATGGWESTTEGDAGEDGQGASIYEKVMGDEWFHDYDTVFDSNASVEKSDDRKIVLTIDPLLGDTYAWYNRGLIAHIPKNRLFYLPYLEEWAGNAVVDVDEDSENDTLANGGSFSEDITFSYGGGGCVTKIVINGSIGTIGSGTDSVVYCRPKITVVECDVDAVGECPDESGNVTASLYSDGGESGTGKACLEPYNVEIVLSRSPRRMLYSNPMLKIKCTILSKQSISLSGLPSIYKSVYVDATETVKVWEQLYITSTGEFGDKNPDGTQSKELRSFDRDGKNAGQYFPTGSNSTNSEGVKMYDKMTMVGAGEQHYEDIDLDISIGNLKGVEQKEQRDLYEDACSMDDYDELNYCLALHPAVSQFFKENDIKLSMDFSGEGVFVSEKLQFNDHEGAMSFDQSGDFWQAGGHYFRWGSSYYKTSCYLIGPVETIFSPEAVHYKHGDAFKVWSPYEAYVGWSKLEFYNGKLDQVDLLEKPVETGYDWSGIASGFTAETTT